MIRRNVDLIAIALLTLTMGAATVAREAAMDLNAPALHRLQAAVHRAEARVCHSGRVERLRARVRMIRDRVEARLEGATGCTVRRLLKVRVE